MLAHSSSTDGADLSQLQEFCQKISNIRNTQPLENADELLQELLSKYTAQNGQNNQKEGTPENNLSEMNSNSNEKQQTKSQEFLNKFLQNQIQDISKIPNLEILIFLIISMQNYQNNEYINNLINTLKNSNLNNKNNTTTTPNQEVHTESERLHQQIKQRDIEISSLNQQLQRMIQEQYRVKEAQVNDYLLTQQNNRLLDSQLTDIIQFIEKQEVFDKKMSDNMNQTKNSCKTEEYASFGVITEQTITTDILLSKCQSLKQKINDLIKSKDNELSHLKKEIYFFTKNSDSNISSISSSSMTRSQNKTIKMIESQITSEKHDCKDSSTAQQCCHALKRSHTVDMDFEESNCSSDEQSPSNKQQLRTLSSGNIINQRDRKDKSGKRVTYQASLSQKRSKRSPSSSSFKMQCSEEKKSQYKKKSSFYKLKERQSQNTSSEESSCSFTFDYLNIKNNSVILKILKKKVSDQNSKSDKYFFSDQVFKFSHSSEKQDRVICMDKTFFYVINSFESASDFKKFFIKDINRIIISSKNQDLCSLHIKKEFELIIEIPHREEFLNYIVNVFKNVLVQTPPTIQTSKNDRMNSNQTVVNRLKTVIMNSSRQNLSQNTSKSQLSQEEQSEVSINIGQLQASPESVNIDAPSPRFNECQLEKAAHARQTLENSQESKKQIFKVIVSKSQGFLKRFFGEQPQNGTIQINGDQIQLKYNQNNSNEQITLQSSDAQLSNNQQTFSFIDSSKTKYSIQLSEQYDSPLLISKLNQFNLNAN